MGALRPLDQDATQKAMLEAARRGEAPALRWVFERHRDRVAGQLLRMTGRPDLVDDLVQEVFIAAFSRLDDFREEARLDTWLFRIAINKARNHWTAAARRAKREQIASQRRSRERLTPEEESMGREHRERLYDALESLPEPLRAAFIARAIEGLSLKEAAEALDAPITTVSYRARRAEQLLCEALGIDPQGDR